ncbi:transposase [Yinghuangia sp. YIM S10712]|uniref:transposase n=1 Tax=Yinghuangia sp. YIM S10712 TaxID=3436930 RepID=UPI003F5291E4
MPWHNGRTEGVNNKIKLLERQTYGRADTVSYASASCSDDIRPEKIIAYENLGRANYLIDTLDV